MSKTGRDMGSKGSTDAFDKFFGDAPSSGNGRSKNGAAKNGKNSKNGAAKNANNGNNGKNSKNGHSSNGASSNGAASNGARSNGHDADASEVAVAELDVAELELTDDEDLDVTRPRDDDPVDVAEQAGDDPADAEVDAELDAELDDDGDAEDASAELDADLEDQAPELEDDTDEHPILPRDATGEYVLPDTVPVEPHDDELEDSVDVDGGDTESTHEHGDDDDATLEVAAIDVPDELHDESGADELNIVVRSDDERFTDDDFADEDFVGDDVADHILEELRRADIDGPVVPIAPQDDSTSMRRRPRRAADYDPAPVPIPARVPRVLGRKPRVRKVTRVVRHVDPWSVFKVAIVANIVLYIIVLTASVLLWNVANATGTVQNVERFFESFGWNSFEFNGGELYHAGWVAGLFVVVGLTGLAVLAATLFNLITDLVGGVRFTVLEEEVVETRTSPMRRFVVRRSEPEVPAVVHDASGVMIREAVVDDTGANVRPTR